MSEPAPDRKVSRFRNMLKQGDKAPAFTLLDQGGNKVKLADYKGRKVLIYFYPES